MILLTAHGVVVSVSDHTTADARRRLAVGLNNMGHLPHCARGRCCLYRPRAADEACARLRLAVGLNDMNHLPHCARGRCCLFRPRAADEAGAVGLNDMSHLPHCARGRCCLFRPHAADEAGAGGERRQHGAGVDAPPGPLAAGVRTRLERLRGARGLQAAGIPGRARAGAARGRRLASDVG